MLRCCNLWSSRAGRSYRYLYILFSCCTLWPSRAILTFIFPVSGNKPIRKRQSRQHHLHMTEDRNAELPFTIIPILVHRQSQRCKKTRRGISSPKMKLCRLQTEMLVYVIYAYGSGICHMHMAVVYVICIYLHMTENKGNCLSQSFLFWCIFLFHLLQEQVHISSFNVDLRERERERESSNTRGLNCKVC